MSSDKNRFVALDGLRGVAAIVVMIYHYTQHSLFPLFRNAPLAVDLFFCLSGFVLAYAYIEKLQSSLSVFEFMKIRVKRLYPIFLFGSLLGILGLILKLKYHMTSLTITELITASILNVIYIPYLGDFFVAYGPKRVVDSIFPINDPGWSLFFELLINVVLASVFVLTKRLSIVSFLILTLCLFSLTLTLQYAPGFSKLNFYGGFSRSCFGIFSGVLVFLAYRKFQPRKLKHYYFITPLLFAILILFNLKISFWYWILSISLLVPIVVFLGTISSVGQKYHLFFSYLGWLSYPIYCIHFPILMIYTSLISQGKVLGVIDCFLCVLITTITSHCAAKFIERTQAMKKF